MEASNQYQDATDKLVAKDDSFDKICRFCGLQKNYGKYLFSTEAMKIGLVAKIKCLFPENNDLINVETVLPKLICDSCETTITYFHEFRSRVRLVQENLQKKVECMRSKDCYSDLHVCLTSRKQDKFVVRLTADGTILCQNCRMTLRTEHIFNDSKTATVCVCNSCGFKANVNSFTILDNNFACPKCIYILSTRENIVKDKKIFQCDVCLKNFGSKGHLNRHTLIHFGSKPFKCEHCGLDFNQKSSLKTHLLIHQKNTPFECKWCGQRFRHKQTLSCHMVSIHGVDSERVNNVYECDKCKKKFVKKDKLKRHYQSHSGEKPFKCNVCFKTFTQKINLKTHYKKHENDDQFIRLDSAIMEPIGGREDHFVSLSQTVIDESKKNENQYSTIPTSVLSDMKRTNQFETMSQSMLNDTEKGKLIQELLSYESMPPENENDDSLGTFSIVQNEYRRDNNVGLKPSTNESEIYFNDSSSSYMYSSNTALFDLEDVPGCSTLPTFSSLNSVN